jgi:Na+-driven multidrug efflux pump
MTMGFLLNKYCNKELNVRFKGFKPSGKLIGGIYKIGLPSILMISVGSVMTYMMNRLLVDIESTETAAAVFNAYFKLQSFVIMPVIGLAQAMMPIVSYNYGAGNKGRMLKTYRLGFLFALCVLSVGTLLMLSVPKLLLGMFSATDEMLKIGAPAFRIIAVAFVIASYGIVTSNFFQSVGNGVLSMLMSLIRQLVVLVPLAYLFGYTLGYSYVWWAIPLAETVSSSVAVFGWFYIKRKILDKMPKESLSGVNVSNESLPNENSQSANFEKAEAEE